jgi:hypothetical protein
VEAILTSRGGRRQAASSDHHAAGIGAHELDRPPQHAAYSSTGTDVPAVTPVTTSRRVSKSTCALAPTSTRVHSRDMQRRSR